MSFSAVRVNQVVRELLGDSRHQTRRNWLDAVAGRVLKQRPDLDAPLRKVLAVQDTTATTAALNAEGEEDSLLDGLSIGEIGACYEALLALTDRQSRKDSGQFFTPDDAAEFMAAQAAAFPEGSWVDPACGVGNLAWHLARAQAEPGVFVARHLSLVDKDEAALRTAIALLAADFMAPDDVQAVEDFEGRCVRGNFLTTQKLAAYDFAILNPPYARAPEQRGYRTSTTRDFFAYFLERVSREAKGFVAVTPAGYLSAPKYQVLRTILNDTYVGGRIFVFDNVPDTVFRGYKYGSTNTSTTNFVRAAITVCSPEESAWQTTPILRWQSGDRARLWQGAQAFLGPLHVGPAGEWAKLLPHSEALWARLEASPRCLADLITTEQTPFHLDVALTPRYFISAAFRSLDRGSKATIFFPDEESRDLAAIVLNSSLPYLWWRALDGGVTFPQRVLMSVPIPDHVRVDAGLLERVRESEKTAVVVKLNAGRANENIKHPAVLVQDLDALVLPELTDEQRTLLYAPSMFTPELFTLAAVVQGEASDVQQVDQAWQEATDE